MTRLIETLISGLSLGSIYALMALGYTMVYGIAKMLNFAHGDIIMVGGYVSFCAMSYLGRCHIRADAGDAAAGGYPYQHRHLRPAGHHR